MGQEWFQAKEWFKIWAADIIVRDRVVHFWSSVDHSEEERRASRIVAENIAGVRRVEEHIVPSLYPIRRAGRPHRGGLASHLTASPDGR